MIRKIISGAQDGVERAALDVAGNLYLGLGGWITQTQAQENSDLIKTCRLNIINSDNPVQAVEQNILESDGVLIITMGDPAENANMGRRLAEQHKLPFLYIDMERLPAFEAAKRIEAWIAEYSIEVLCITGSRDSRHTNIYKIAKDLLEVVFQLHLIDPRRYENDKTYPYGDTERRLEEFIRIPRTVKEAVDYLILKLNFQDRTRIANMQEKRLPELVSSLEDIIRDEFRLWGANDPLIKDCLALAETDEEDPADIITRALWLRLRKSDNVLRVVK
ncbi:MAG: putative molybdenum carrier protein [Desulfococcaceae bacterium]